MHQYVIILVGIRFLFGNTTDKFNKFISWLSTFGIILGVSSLIIVLSVMNGFENDLEKNILSFMPQVIITNTNSSINKKEILKQDLLFPGIQSVSSIITDEIIIQSEKNISIGTMLGIDPEENDLLEPYFINAEKKDLKANKYNIILGKKLAYYLKVKKGDLVRIISSSNSKFTIIGRIPMQRLFKVIGIFETNCEVDNYQVIINQKDASKLMNYQLNYITGWRLYLKNPLKIHYLSKLQNKIIKKNLVWTDWRNIRGDLFQAVKIEKNIMIILVSLIILIAVFNIITFIILLIIDKKEDIAILQTQGISKIKIIMIFMIQGITLGIIGVFFGNILAILICKNINKIMPILNNIFQEMILPVHISTIQVIMINILTILTIIFSTIYPVWKISKTKPVETLRYV